MPQKNLVLILARDLADKLASAVIVVDSDATLMYFNEECAELLGRTFAEVGEVPVTELSKSYSPTDIHGRPLDSSELPVETAIRTRGPSHRLLRITGPGGETRDLAATAIPLFAHEGELVGALGVFWDHSPGGEG